MSDQLIQIFEEDYKELRATYPEFKAGDTINVAVRIKEGNKERIQNFQGAVIQRRNEGSNGETFTVRKISNGIGIERIFPITSPNIESIKIVRKGKVRRARLFYLRGRHGKSARIKENKTR
jgi:large subunit ribosomal protein L19